MENWLPVALTQLDSGSLAPSIIERLVLLHITLKHLEAKRGTKEDKQLYCLFFQNLSFLFVAPVFCAGRKPIFGDSDSI